MGNSCYGQSGLASQVTVGQMLIQIALLFGRTT
jgi:hypothetical protein